MSRLASGHRIGAIVVERMLASGGMAEIYAAHRDGIELVVKRMHPHLARDAEFVEMFEDEVRITSTLHHPGVVAVLDVIRERDEVFLVLERVAGVDLSRVIARARERAAGLDVHGVLGCVHHLADALAFVHAATDATGAPLGIVHRDLTPRNLMARRTRGACILDFGVARAASRHARTTGSITKGSSAYLSPEQANLETVGPPSDVYQLGLVLFELLTGQRALAGHSPLELMRAASRPVHRAPSSIRADTPRDIDALAEAMRRLDPIARPSAREVAQMLAPHREHASLADDVETSPLDEARAVARRDAALEIAAELDDDDTQPIRRA